MTVVPGETFLPRPFSGGRGPGSLVPTLGNLSLKVPEERDLLQDLPPYSTRETHPYRRTGDSSPCRSSPLYVRDSGTGSRFP